MTALTQRLPQRASFGIVYLLLAAAAFTGGFSLSLFGMKTQTMIQKVGVPAVVKSGAEAARALGKPDQTVDGAQINPALKGLTCGVWQSKAAIVCYAA